MAKKLGLPVFTESLPRGVYGALFRYPQGAIILVDPNTSRERARFTVAHELGHWILEKTHDPVYCQAHALQDRVEERLADRFAAALLMPADAVLHYWLKGEAFTSLAARFDVSYEAMHWRLVELGLV